MTKYRNRISTDWFFFVVFFFLWFKCILLLFLQNSLATTGTYKLKKAELVQEGFDPNLISDPLYFLDEKKKNYVPLTVDIFNDVTSGQIKIWNFSGITLKHIRWISNLCPHLCQNLYSNNSFTCDFSHGITAILLQRTCLILSTESDKHMVYDNHLSLCESSAWNPKNTALLC